jgi:hypothetical protein
MDGLRGLNGVVLKSHRSLREEGDVQHCAWNDSVAHAREQYARIVGLRDAEKIAALADLRGEALEIGQAPRRPQGCPLRKGVGRCPDGGIDMLRQPLRHGAERALVDRGKELEALR